jgi:hypothetical protein
MIERLEPRRFFSASASISRGGTLYVRGTGAGDDIAFSYDVPSRTLAVLDHGGTVATYDLAAVRRVFVDALAGADRVNLAGPLPCCTVLGGDGDDTLLGSIKDDVLHGDAGNDSLFGDYGDDSLYGDTGNDTLDGSHGTDILHGGGGTDSWRPSPGLDYPQGAFAFRDDQGRTTIDDDINSTQIHAKFLTANGHKYLRLTVNVPQKYDTVTFGPLGGAQPNGADLSVAISLKRPIYPPPIFSLEPVLPDGYPRRAYYDLGLLASGVHNVAVIHLDNTVIRTLPFSA